jgi:hypothetical protein
MVENRAAVSSGTTTTTAAPQLAEKYQLDPPRSRQWSYQQYSPPDEAGL